MSTNTDILTDSALKPEAEPDVGAPYRRVYAGRRVWGNAPEEHVAHVWFDVDTLTCALDPSTDIVGGGRGWKHPPKKQGATGAFVGAVYEFTPTRDGGSYYTSGKHAPRYVRSFHIADHPDGGKIITGWRAMDQAAEVWEDREKAREAKKDESSLRALLAPIREQYRRTNARGRRALLAAVLEAITG